jgi:tripartite-type tricarboxylate transporter receptor subunit TctC
MTTNRIASLFAALLLSFRAFAQDLPTKPIKVIVPYAAGGGATSSRGSSASNWASASSNP